VSDNPPPNDFTLAHDAFVQSIKVNSTSPHALFLGAGASISSNVPSAMTCIWQWKREIFLTNNPELGNRYDALKNTPAELQCQDRQLRTELIAHLRDTTLIVSGYSGRDDSVMSALRDAYTQPGTGRLYWCGYGDMPADVVTALLAHAQAHGRLAYYVPTSGFDDLMAHVALACLTGDLLNRARSIYTQAASSPNAPMPPFAVDSAAISSIIKSNALAVECPSEVLQFDADGFDGPRAWHRLRSQTEGTNIVAALLKGKVLALGTIDEVKRAFCDRGISVSLVSIV
jgi:hypothetical protein